MTKMREWNVRVVASVLYYQEFLVAAETKEEAERDIQKDIDNDTLDYQNDVQKWAEYHEGDNVNYWISDDHTEDVGEADE